MTARQEKPDEAGTPEKRCFEILHILATGFRVWGLRFGVRGVFGGVRSFGFDRLRSFGLLKLMEEMQDFFRCQFV